GGSDDGGVRRRAGSDHPRRRRRVHSPLGRHLGRHQQCQGRDLGVRKRDGGWAPGQLGPPWSSRRRTDGTPRTHMRKPRIRFRSQRGQAMTEFAIIAPILLLTLMGIMQLGAVYNNWVTLTDAARAGARKAAVCRSGCSPDASTATVNAVKNSAANLNLSNL